MSKSLRDDPPARDEIEVSMFGPGRGESILVHIGGGKWITIDSCLNSRTRSSPALNYLNSLGVDVSNDVVLVIATHAHDDHTAGISQIFEAARSARFVTSAAFTSTEFFAAVDADREIETQMNQSVRREFRGVLGEARKRGVRQARPIIRATEQREIYREEVWPDGPIVTITALSPSDTAIDRSHENVSVGSARAGERRRLSAGDPNEYSVAIWVEIGDHAMLFGGDLLIGPSGCGWAAVLDSHRPRLQADLIKVPHHGSQNAHHPPMWSEFIDQAGVAVLTPFRNGPKTIPRQADLERINGLIAATYLSATTVPPAPSKAVKETRRKLPHFARNVREVDGLPGHILARRILGSETWNIELHDPAIKAQ